MATNKQNILNFLKELRESSERIFIIFTKGSCFRLYNILKTFEPTAQPYWSDLCNHAIVKINKVYYDIGGEVTQEYAENNNYYLILEKHRESFYLLKYTETPELAIKIEPSKYANNQENNKTK